MYKIPISAVSTISLTSFKEENHICYSHFLIDTIQQMENNANKDWQKNNKKYTKNALKKMSIYNIITMKM